MRLKTVLTILLAVNLAGIYTAASGVGEADAGQPGDAGNSKETARILPGAGVYEGHLWLPGDQDWFKADLPGDAMTPRCVEFTAASRKPTTGYLDIQQNGVSHPATTTFKEERGYDADGRPIRYWRGYGGVAGFEDSTAFLGLTPTFANDSSWAWYNFRIASVNATEAGPENPATGGDAGNTFETATPAGGPCVGGQLRLAQQDGRDVYTFAIEASKRVTFSYAATGDNSILRIYDPAREFIAALGPGEVMELTLSTPGTYSMEAGRADLNPLGQPGPLATSAFGTDLTTQVNVEYLIGIVGGPDKPRPGCRPTCEMSS